MRGLGCARLLLFGAQQVDKDKDVAAKGEGEGFPDKCADLPLTEPEILDAAAMEGAAIAAEIPPMPTGIDARSLLRSLGIPDISVDRPKAHSLTVFF